MKLDDLPTPENEGTVHPEELISDGSNPNYMQADMFDLLKDKIKQRGWIGNAIIADTNGVIADGEHRWRAAREIGLEEVPVKQYDMTEEKRKVIRQEMNKLSGKHDPDADRREFEEVLDSEEEDDLIALLDSRNEDIDELMDPTDEEFWDEDDDFNDDIAFKQECPECGHEWFEQPD